MRDASFGASGATVGPVTLDVLPGKRAARVFGSSREAGVVALLAAGIVKATSGSVLIDQYDPRVQSAHCKRIAAFVPHAALPLEDAEFERYIAYRAALWGLEPMRAVAHAKLLMERLEGMHEAFAYPLVGALVGGPKILVLDRPQPAYASHIIAAAGPSAIFSTHVNATAAGVFSQSERQEAPA
jgi:ABC-type taurine transport system ATPase subunit